MKIGPHSLLVSLWFLHKNYPVLDRSSALETSGIRRFSRLTKIHKACLIFKCAVSIDHLISDYQLER